MITALRGAEIVHATFRAMHSASIYFTYFWFSHRSAAGEADVHAN